MAMKASVCIPYVALCCTYGCVFSMRGVFGLVDLEMVHLLVLRLIVYSSRQPLRVVYRIAARLKHLICLPAVLSVLV